MDVYKNLDSNKIKDVLESLDTALVIVKSRRIEDSNKKRYKDYLTITNNKVRENTDIFKEFEHGWGNARLKFKIGFNACDPNWKCISDYLEELEDGNLNINEIVVVYSSNGSTSKITYKNI